MPALPITGNRASDTRLRDRRVCFTFILHSFGMSGPVGE